jgi:hypothetical protein
MAEKKYLKCYCDHCVGRIEFPAEGIGATIPCPHCGRPTELVLEVPKEKKVEMSSRSRKWFIAGAAILLVGAVATVAILLTAQRMMKKTREKNEALRRTMLPARTNAPAVKGDGASLATVANNFSASSVAIDKTAGSSLTYATGTLRNDADKRRFGVTVELELLDRSGKSLGNARDYTDLIEPRADWKFRALLVQKNVASARIASVKEQE